ncbi:sugar transferase [Chitinophagaceae bacterium LB-8]|uniref:Sugar transferase n=1 Tax=Paraflavisolibacter caeni TaxID=2982496 RepID=A0A9X2XY38_9BACT|nr:sugar transferase [Paraflavisolibacter caeni]MCU7550857.1 sugar transferase [Paraflavisolibacter caeni]
MNGSSVLFLISKRLFDIVVSLLVTIFLLSWLLPILAILIKLDSKGPVFFCQKRIGAYGKPFYCIKLRSMVENAMANVEQAGANDPRITRFGKFLRYSYLDELPQFINVLNGDMSIVGPRPHMINDCLSFLQVIPDYNLRHTMKPGITGMAQIKGYRGKVNTYFDVTHRFKLDMFYIKKANFLLDLKIFLATIAQLLFSINKLYQSQLSIKVEVQAPKPAQMAKPAVKKVAAPVYQKITPPERQSA